MAVALTAAATPRSLNDVRVFARVGFPGQPEPIAVGPDGLVYVGTNQENRGIGSPARSRIFVYDRHGRVVRTEVIRGQDLSQSHGVIGLIFDGSGLLYVLDRSTPARVIRLDPATGKQRTFATFPDVPLCGPGRASDCSFTPTDLRPGPDVGAFAPDGSLYVTDLEQGVIWRVPRGGGRARVWFTDPRLGSGTGPNGLQVRADGKSVLFVVTTGTAPDKFHGLVLELPITSTGKPGTLRDFWSGLPGLDGLVISRGGNVYVAQALFNYVLKLSPTGQEVARIPATDLLNSAQPVPFNGPASLAFLGKHLLVTNQTLPTSQPAAWAVLDIPSGERGLPLFTPAIAPLTARPRLRVSVRPRFAVRDRPTRFSFHVSVGHRQRARRIAGARITFAGHTLRTNSHGTARAVLRLTERGQPRVRATAVGLRDGSAGVKLT